MFTFLIIFNLVLALIVKLYCKLTMGICKCSKHLVGKVVIVTGANGGVGYETAKDMAERGARVILACRSDERGMAARDKIIAATRNNDVHYRRLDLASLASVRAFAEGVIAAEKRLDILINNAGILETGNTKTEDGLLLIMQTNYFGPFLLTSLLLPLLKSSAPSRIVMVSSLIYSSGKIEFDNLNAEKDTGKEFDFKSWYATSKMCNMLMTVELAKKLEGTGVTANSLHPGVVATDLMLTFKDIWRYPLMLLQFFFKTPWEGAQTSIFLAVSPEMEGVSGKYFADCRERVYSERARDKAVAKKLWEVSERIVGIK